MDLTKNPYETAQSLLEERQAERRNRRKRNDTNLLLNLAGQVVGGVLQGRQQEKFNNFMNNEGVLQEKAIVRSAVDKSQAIAERARTAASYTGGKRKFFYDELVQLYQAQLDTNLSKDGKYYDPAGVKKLAEKMAGETVGQYITNFDTQLSAAQDVLNATDNDRLAYSKALREASGLDLGVIGRGMRKLTSYFLDEEDRNTDGALYRSVTSSRIYNESKEFQETFDKYYTQTGNALVADKVAEWETDPKNKEQLRKLSLKSEFRDFKLPDGTTVTAIVEQRPDGSPARIRPLTDLTDAMSPETAKAFGSSGLRGDKATTYVGEIQGILDDDTRGKLSDLIGSRQIEGNTKLNNAFTEELASTLNQFEIGLRNSYSDLSVITDERIKSIAARAILIDVENNDNRFRLSKSNAIEQFTTDNPILTFMAASEEYGSVEDIPEEFRSQINMRMQEFFEQQLPAATSPARIEETIDFVKSADNFFGTDIADLMVGKTPILEALEISRARAEAVLKFENKQALGEIPENISFRQYMQSNEEAVAEMNANIRRTSQQRAADAQAGALAGPKATPFTQYAGI